MTALGMIVVIDSASADKVSILKRWLHDIETDPEVVQAEKHNIIEELSISRTAAEPSEGQTHISDICFDSSLDSSSPSHYDSFFYSGYQSEFFNSPSLQSCDPVKKVLECSRHMVEIAKLSGDNFVVEQAYQYYSSFRTNIEKQYGLLFNNF